jgi:5'-deoxy-5'-methylthioadenosine phosphorylase
MLGIIGGSGASRLAALENTRRQVIRTPYGEPSGALTYGLLRGREVVFLARHGYDHTIPPHAVNYRANIWALAAQGVHAIVGIAAVGGIRSDLAPGAVAVPSQILDYTYGRRATFFDGSDDQVRHIDFTEPYTPAVRAALLQAGRNAEEPIIDGGVYAAMQGPRLETAAEIDRLQRDGADMVGMTGMPEAALAREASLAYATLAVVVNWAAGRASSRSGIAVADIDAVLDVAMTRVARILMHLEVPDGGKART